MELRHLRYFVAVAEELHFSRAAARLHIAQPALSQQIRQLERELGVDLLARSSRRVTLTDAGEVFLRNALRVLEGAEEARRSAQRAGRGEVGRLSVGFVGTAADLLPLSLGPYRERYPEVIVELHELGSAAQIQMIVDGKLHVGLCRVPAADERLHVKVIRRESLVVAMPTRHRLADQHEIAVAELASEQFVLPAPSQSASFNDVVIGVCAQAGFTPYVAQEAGEQTTQLALVAARMGIALMPGSASRLRTRGVVYRPLKAPAPVTEVVVAWRRDGTSTLAQAFVDTVLRATKRT